jgi:MerR family transcriptional regulator/heat shock protein HspR
VSSRRSESSEPLTPGDTGDTQAVFVISIAAERADMQIQNLRVYERRGLLAPARTPGGTRLYSEADVRVLRRIATLLGEGLNLAGIGRVLALESQIAALRELLEPTPH